MDVLTSSDRSGFPLLVALVFSVTVGGIIGGVTGFVTTLPSGFAVAFALPGVLIGAVAGAAAVLAGITADRLVRRRKGDSAVARIVTTMTASLVSALLVALVLSVANNPKVVWISLFSIGISAALAYVAHPRLLKECGKR